MSLAVGSSRPQISAQNLADQLQEKMCFFGRIIFLLDLACTVEHITHSKVYQKRGGTVTEDSELFFVVSLRIHNCGNCEEIAKYPKNCNEHYIDKKQIG